MKLVGFEEMKRIGLIVFVLMSFASSDEGHWMNRPKSNCLDYKVAPKHGGNGGKEFKIECPLGGAVTGINYRAGSRVEQLEFVCKCSAGESIFGPYGGKESGKPGSLHCPKGHYISSFFGRSGDTLDRLGIRCRPLNGDLAYGVLQNSFGGNGGTEFNDLALSIGRRPTSITVRVWNEVNSIQVTYAIVNGEKLHNDTAVSGDRYMASNCYIPTAEVESCVASVQPNKFVSNLSVLEDELENCFH